MHGLHGTALFLSWLCMSAFIVIFLPLAIWSGLILRRDWNKVYIVKRRQALVLCTYCGLCLLPSLRVIGLPLLLLLFPTIDDSVFLMVDSGVLLILTLPATLFLGWTIVTRVWLFYYDSMLSNFKNNKEWRMAIDPTKEDAKYNWFVQNVMKWGNTSYLVKRMIIVTVIESSLFAMGFLINHKDLGQILANIFMSISFLIRICLGLHWFNLIRKRVSQDNIGILKEIKTSCVGMLWVIFGGLGLSIIAKVMEIEATNRQLCFVLFTVISCCMYVYVIVPYCRKLFVEYCESPIDFAFENIQLMTKKVRKHKLRIGKSNNIDGNENKFGQLPSASQTPSMTSISKPITWRDVVATYDGYILFVNHLGKEWSTENMLYIQEVTLHSCLQLFLFFVKL